MFRSIPEDPPLTKEPEMLQMSLLGLVFMGAQETDWNQISTRLETRRSFKPGLQPSRSRFFRDSVFPIRVIAAIRFFIFFGLGFTPWYISGYAGHNAAPLVTRFPSSWGIPSHPISFWTTVATLIFCSLFPNHGRYPNRISQNFEPGSLP